MIGRIGPRSLQVHRTPLIALSVGTARQKLPTAE